MHVNSLSSKITSSKIENGKKIPEDGKLWYRGYQVQNLISSLAEDEFGFEKVAYLLLMGDMPEDEEYRKLFAVVFQDFKLFAFSLKENICFSLDEEDSKIDMVLKESGLYDDVQKMPKKSLTCLWKSFDKEGLELSGGQKQKTALSRALYKDSPIVILDEPTAALDPIAEADVYSRFNTTLAGGRTAIYISHRLSSCKFCDKIAVFSDKSIREYGNHQELMKNKNGIYYKMFETQAKQYR